MKGELVCECAAADLERRGLRFVVGARAGLRPRRDGSGWWMLECCPRGTYRRESYLHTYCPFCGRKPRMFRAAEREPLLSAVSPPNPEVQP